MPNQDTVLGKRKRSEPSRIVTDPSVARSFSGDFAMPSYSSYNRSRTSAVSRLGRGRRRRQLRRYKTQRVPRALFTRGTPQGYYEIPTTQLIRIYTNTSTGFFGTDQNTGNAIGAVGYRGIGIASSLSDLVVNLGEGGTSATIIQSWPGFNELQYVFDECKIVSMDFDFWVTSQVPSASNTASLVGGPDLFLAYDPSDAFPPPNQAAVLQYNDIKRVCFDSNQRTSMSIIPKTRVDIATSSDGSTTATTASQLANATYNLTSMPAGMHYGVRGWVTIPTHLNPANLYQINILCRQVRRYKCTK